MEAHKQCWAGGKYQDVLPITLAFAVVKTTIICVGSSQVAELDSNPNLSLNYVFLTIRPR